LDSLSMRARGENIENTRTSFSRPDPQTLSYEVITFSMGANKS